MRHFTVISLSSLGKVSSTRPFQRISCGTEFECSCRPIGPSLMRLGSGAPPTDTRRAIHGHTHPIALGQDFDVVPVVLLADFLGGTAVHGQTVAAEEIVHAVSRWEHHKVPGVGVFGAVL